MAKHRFHAKTEKLVHRAIEVLAEFTIAVTVRQLYYQMVVRQFIENKNSEYKRLGNAVVSARQNGMISWSAIEDRLRRPRMAPAWRNIQDFFDSVIPQYRRDIWPSQPAVVHVWLEKDALSGIFEDALEPYGVTLHVGRGYDSWSSIYEASRSFEVVDPDTPIRILYFGDLDPSGTDMPRSLGERLRFFGQDPEIEVVAILKEDIARYNLPPDVAKVTDSRRNAFVAEYGTDCVELDALPPNVLRERLIKTVEANLYLERLRETRELERAEREKAMAAARRWKR